MWEQLAEEQAQTYVTRAFTVHVRWPYKTKTTYLIIVSQRVEELRASLDFGLPDVQYGCTIELMLRCRV